MSIAKVAKLAGVSSTTVSFVINKKPGISTETAMRVKAAMNEIGYVPKVRGDSSAKKLHMENTGLNTGNIGLVLRQDVISTNPFYARIFEALHKVLDEKKLTMVPTSLPANTSSLRSGSLSDLDGIILFNYTQELAGRIKLPFVSILGHPDPEQRLFGDHIEAADDRIGAMASRYLIERGHTRLLAVDPSVSFHSAFHTRVEFFAKTAAKRGIEASIKKVPFMDRDQNQRLRDGADIDVIVDFVSEYQNSEDKPTGIFVPDDSHLVVLQKSMQAHGVKPGIDVEFIGCNDTSVLLDGLEIRPATVNINPDGIARSALNMLLQRIREPGNKDAVCQVVHVEPLMIEPSGVAEWMPDQR